MKVPALVDGAKAAAAPQWSLGSTRKPAITVVGYRAFTQLMHSVVEEFAEQAQIRFVDHIFNVSGEDPANKAALTGDVVVSAGANAGYLSASLAVPVLKLPVTQTDILRSVLKAKRVASRIAVFIHGERSDFVAMLAQELALDIEQYSYLTPDEAAEKFLLASRAGLQVVVGSSLLCHLAEKRDIPAILLYSRSSCRALLRDAVAEGRALLQRRHFDAVVAGLLEDPERPTAVTDAAGTIQSMNVAMREGLCRSQRDRRRTADLIRLRLLDQAQDSIEVTHAEQDWVVTRSRVIVDMDVLGYVFRFDRPQRSYRTTRPQQDPAFQFVSERIRTVLDLARLYASTEAAVLIQGESGCGKEVVARTIFDARPAPRGDFIAVNCSAIPDDLFESEMFGHVEGAFTGAKSGGKKGLFELANGGLIFLDEVGDLPLSQQAKLLRVLQQRSIRPVGGTVERQIQFKLVAATNVDLQEKVRSGAFRNDLYYRINVLSLTVPPLRERPEEVDAIAEQAIAAVRERLPFRYRLQREGSALLQRLRGYSWPGNVRELESMMQRVVTHLLISDSPDTLHAALPRIVPELFQRGEPSAVAERAVDSGTLRSRELQAIREAMQRFQGDRSRVAQHLGISRATLWRRLQEIAKLS
jgi:propionate catabolism operon transcriptional regulator